MSSALPAIQGNRTIPSDDEVRRLLAASRESKDFRAAPAISLLLAAGATVDVLLQAQWIPDVNFRSYEVVLRGPGQFQKLAMTELLARQLLGLRRAGHPTRLFGKPEPCSPPLGRLLRQVLDGAGLEAFSANDFARWSDQQTEKTRRAVITA